MVIYKTTNLVNGKQYIGRDSHNNPNYLGSGVLLQRAISKYGKDNFKKEIIEECLSLENLIRREEYWLDYYDAGNNPMFYNVHNKGNGYSVSGEKHPMYGKEPSEETRQKISKANRGQKRTDETKRKISQALTGRKISEETRIKNRNSHLGKKPHENAIMKLRELGGKNSPHFKGYVLCVKGQYENQSKTISDWSSILNVGHSHISGHLYGKKYKNGIKGNFFVRECKL